MISNALAHMAFDGEADFATVKGSHMSAIGGWPGVGSRKKQRQQEVVAQKAVAPIEPNDTKVLLNTRELFERTIITPTSKHHTA